MNMTAHLDDSTSSPRTADASALAEALSASRADTLATFAAYEAALPGLQVPLHSGLNPPRWELGHIGWFQEFWIARNPQRERGAAADPDAVRVDCVRANADALYNSSMVPHDQRWILPLPSADETREDLRRQLEHTLDELARAEPSDAGLYFFRLALLHEDMHHEAALYMAQALGVPIADPRWQPRPASTERSTIDIEAGPRRIGWTGSGFAFDNELGAHDQFIEAFEIDTAVVCWRDYLSFIEAGGYADQRLWSPQGWAWRQSSSASVPRYLSLARGRWHRRCYERLEAIDLDQPASHLSYFEADAWCRWAGRRLPTEAEWETAAREALPVFSWGQVWEWTASEFRPYPGFVAHPYRDYSQPWFDGRPVLRGASWTTQPRMRDPRYRNFFPAGRNDIVAGFRSCRR